MPTMSNRQREAMWRRHPSEDGAHAAADLRPIPGAGADIGEDDDIPANRPAGWPRLTSAGKFWLAYAAGIVSALLLVHWGAR